MTGNRECPDSTTNRHDRAGWIFAPAHNTIWGTRDHDGRATWMSPTSSTAPRAWSRLRIDEPAPHRLRAARPATLARSWGSPRRKLWVILFSQRPVALRSLAIMSSRYGFEKPRTGANTAISRRSIRSASSGILVIITNEVQGSVHHQVEPNGARRLFVLHTGSSTRNTSGQDHQVAPAGAPDLPATPRPEK